MDDDTFSDDSLGVGELNVCHYRQQSYPQDGTLLFTQFRSSAPEMENLPARSSSNLWEEAMEEDSTFIYI